LLKEHQITEHGRKKENVTGPIDKFMGSNNFTTKKSEFNPEMFKQILLIWMVKHNISFIEVENEEFRNLQKYGQSLGAALIPQSGNTIKSWILALFYDNKNNLKNILQNAPGKIHLTLDLWSSPNHLPLLGVIAHFSDKNGLLQQSLLGLRTIEGAHSGENMAEVVLNILFDYGIEGSLGYLMMDNASSNDTLVLEIENTLLDKGIVFDADTHRLRCIAHTINLSVKAFLFGKDAKVLF
jgi:hypothetical protein